MVAFQKTMGGYIVLVNEKPFGYVNEERGYFTDPTVVRCFMEVGPNFAAIQEKVPEVTHLRTMFRRRLAVPARKESS